MIINSMAGEAITRDGTSLLPPVTKGRTDGYGVAGTEVQAVLERMLASQTFAKSQRMSRLLRFIVEQAVSGNTMQLKEYAIGLEVFDRNAATYNPGEDPIVRVQIGRLREKLQQYYQSGCDKSGIRFEIPLGTYIPTIRRVVASHAACSQNGKIMILSIKGLTVDTVCAEFAQGLREELLHHLFIGIGGIVMPPSQGEHPPQNLTTMSEVLAAQGVGYLLEGSVRMHADQVRVTLRLIEASSGNLAWSAQFDRRIDSSLQTQSELAQDICQALKMNLLEQRGGSNESDESD